MDPYDVRESASDLSAWLRSERDRLRRLPVGTDRDVVLAARNLEELLEANVRALKEER
jgi:hypothetical protein